MVISTRIATPVAQACNIQLIQPSQSIARVMHQIRVMRQPSRATLVKTLGYSQPSATHYVNALIDAGLVHTQIEPGHSIRAGRPAEQLVVDSHHFMVWGIHIGIRSTEIVVSDVAGRVLRTQSIPLRIIEHSATDALGRICQKAHKLAHGLSQPVMMGVAFSEHMGNSGSITLSVYGWDGVATGEITADILGKPVFVASGVSAMAGSELAHTPLDDGSLVATPQKSESTLYFYARKVIVYAWIFRGVVHRPHSGVVPRAFSQIAQSGTFEVEEGTHPLGNSVVVNAARAQRIPAANLAHLVEIAKRDGVTRRLLGERAELLGRIVRLAIDIVNPTTVVFAGDAFTTDPQGMQLIAQQLRREAHGPSDLRIQRASQSIVRDTARVVATRQLWQNPLGTLKAYA